LIKKADSSSKEIGEVFMSDLLNHLFKAILFIKIQEKTDCSN